jgi:hypothetical protein
VLLTAAAGNGGEHAVSAVMRVAAIILVAFGICAYVVSGYRAWTDDRTIATATITEVRQTGSHRRIYDVIFTTQQGLACQSTVDSGYTAGQLTWQPRVGATVKVRYQSSGLPCDRVIESEDEAPFLQHAIPFVFLLVGIVAAHLACRTLSRGGGRSRATPWARERYS